MSPTMSLIETNLKVTKLIKSLKKIIKSIVITSPNVSKYSLISASVRLGSTFPTKIFFITSSFFRGLAFLGSIFLPPKLCVFSSSTYVKHILTSYQISMERKLIIHVATEEANSIYFIYCWRVLEHNKSKTARSFCLQILF